MTRIETPCCRKAGAAARPLSLFPSRGPNWLSNPGRCVSEDLGRSGGRPSRPPCGARSKTSRPRNRAAAPKQSVFSKTPGRMGASRSLGRSSFVPALPSARTAAPASVRRIASPISSLSGSHNIDVADSNLCFARDVGQARWPRTTFWYPAHRRTNQPAIVYRYVS